MSTGAFGYPMEPAAEVALGEVLTTAGQLAGVRTVRFVLSSDETLRLHAEVLQRLVSS